DLPSNSISLVLEVNEGPLVRLAVAGAKISQHDLKKLVPVYQEGSVDADLLEEGKRNLRERLERAGYFDAKVDYAVAARELAASKRGGNLMKEFIPYPVERGTPHELSRIEIQGNHSFSPDLLKNRLAITTTTWFTRPHFSRRLLEADVLSMK